MSPLYVAMGDSVAVGYRGAPGQDYVTQIYRHLWQANPEWRYLKVASAGAKTPDLRRQVQQALAARPNLITLNIGGNDLRHAKGNPYRVIPFSLHNLDMALGTLRRHTAAPVFVAGLYNPAPRGTPAHAWADGLVDEFNRGLRGVAARHGCVFVPIGKALARSPDSVIAYDRLHPSSEGHSVIAATFLRAGVARRARLAG